ncbi:mitochondrial DNA primase [Trypanosoma theileri]|uniref:Mitochondrial DNA primase n=1 Tax=Trypanosoma theileri TaxID=67003 RepID=A0A1X0NXL3_9TRYP|nr:mitochondrial DNA primase [Trypanosoma theileri]ORC89223.1 mitochondrial DNA primase [Trypanosoma theileri]
MLRISLFTRQVSKRLVAELAAMNSAAKAKTSASTSDTVGTNPAATSTSTSAAAAAVARAAAEEALEKTSHKSTVPLKKKIVSDGKNTTKGQMDGKKKKKKKVQKVSRDLKIDSQKEEEEPVAAVKPKEPEITPILKKEKVEEVKVSDDRKEEKMSVKEEEEKVSDKKKEEKMSVKEEEEKVSDKKKEETVSVRKVSTSTTPSTLAAKEKKEDITSQKKTPIIKSFRIEDVAAACKPTDGLFARRLPQGGCQFFAWPGTPLSVASNAVATMPDTIRTVHAIFGREQTPLDLVLDIDCPVPQEHWSMSKIRPFQKKLLDETLTVVKEEIEAIGEKIATQVVLQSPNLKKASFHVHTKLQDVAFEDYHSLHGFLYRFHKKIPHVDLQIYRAHGMLRMHRCMKENHTSAIVVFEDKEWNIGFPNGIVPDAVAALHSVCVREPGTYSRLLHFDAPRTSQAQEETLIAAAGSGGDVHNSGKSGEVKLPAVLLPRTEREAVETVSAWLRNGTREADVGDWRSWISLGINAYRIAYHFRDAKTLARPAMEELLDAWVAASKKCGMKFRPGVCEARWSSFDIVRLSKAGEDDWWGPYRRIGRMAMVNAAADAAAASAKASGKGDTASVGNSTSAGKK